MVLLWDDSDLLEEILVAHQQIYKEGKLEWGQVHLFWVGMTREAISTWHQLLLNSSSQNCVVESVDRIDMAQLFFIRE